MSLAGKYVQLVELGAWSKYFDPKVLAQKVPVSANEQTLVAGIQQRNKIVPKDVSLEGNKRGIGFIQHNYTNTVSQNNPLRYPVVNDVFGRTARVTLKDTSHMHDTPTQPGGYRWCVEQERMSVWKTNYTGWTYSNDSVSKRNIYFSSLENAIHYCNIMGLGYDVEYPKFKYTIRRSYADNFKWPGDPNKEDTDC